MRCKVNRCRISRFVLLICGIFLLLCCSFHQQGLRYYQRNELGLFRQAAILKEAIELVGEQRNTTTTIDDSSVVLPLIVGNSDQHEKGIASETAIKEVFLNRSKPEQSSSLTTEASLTSATPPLASSESTTAPVAPQRVESALFMVNHIMTTRKPINPNCHRTCLDHRNKIYLPFADELGAGLLDRLLIIGSILNIAGYLCARLYVPLPKFMLSAFHNANQPVDARVTWSEFGNFSFWNDPSGNAALVDWYNPLNSEDRPVLEYIFNDTNANLIHHAKLPKQVKFQLRAFEQYTMAQQATLLANKNNSNNQTGGEHFVWILESWFYGWDNLLANHLQTRQQPQYYASELDKQKEPSIFATRKIFSSCQYAKVELPHHLQEVREAVVAQILAQSTASSPLSTSVVPPPAKSLVTSSLPETSVLLGYFHIRRQDSQDECDTSLSRIESYLNCSLVDALSRLSKTGAHSGRRMIVLFSSDEREEHYRQELSRLIGELGKHDNADTFPITAVDLDHLVRQKVHKEVESGRFPAWRNNNFYLFQSVLLIGYNQSITQFLLEKRRSFSCGECANVTAQLMQAGVLDENTL